MAEKRKRSSTKKEQAKPMRDKPKPKKRSWNIPDPVDIPEPPKIPKPKETK